MVKKLLLVTVPLIILIVCGIGALFLIDANLSTEKVYVQQLEMADKYYETNDYENAIVYYKKAIEINNTNEKPYITLAKIYYKKSDIQSAISILQKGETNTKSENIRSALAYYLDIFNNSSEAVIATVSQEDTGKIQTYLLNIFASYDFSKYINNYAVSSEKYEDNKYVVRYQNINADFYYYNTNENSNIINNTTKKPEQNAMPNEIILDNVNELIAGLSNGVTEDILKSQGVSNLIKTFDKGENTYLLTFSINNCTVTVACNQSGKIDIDNSYNKIVPPETEILIESVQVRGRILNTENYEAVNDVNLVFRKGLDNKKGEILHTLTVSDGTYNIELEPDDYTVEVSSTGYQTEYFDINVSNRKQTMTQDFELTLLNQPIKIIVTPTDTNTTSQYAELHCVISSSTGATDYVGRTSVYDNSKFVENGKTIATYEETANSQIITIYDVNSIIDFHLHGSCGAESFKIEVQFPGKASQTFIAPDEPISFSSPYSYLNIFEIYNGDILNTGNKVN